MDAGKTAAADLLAKLQINNPDDLRLLDKIAWRHRALIREAPLLGSEARLNYDPAGKSIITVSNNIDSIERKRFSIAHELGHLILHAQSKLLYLCSKEDINYQQVKRSQVIEAEANEFAAHFLLPTQFLCERFVANSPSFDLINDIASEFQTSLTATALRFLDFTEEPMAVVSSQNGFIEWFQATQDFMDSGAFVDVRAKVRKPSGAASFFLEGYPPPMKWRKVPALTWLKDGKIDDSIRIKEWSIAMPRYSSVLTLLWLPDELYENDDELFFL